jgi:2-desacetyl-2-hydroxyethyl bacteriochlorophyllide A dehydrogenase
MADPTPDSTRAVVWYGPHDLRLEERPLPPLGPRDVLVEVAACGLCGTDVHAVEGLISFYRPPRVLGHEASGTVRAVGSAVRTVQPGAAVAIDPSLGCGACFYCHEGKPYTCPNRVGYGSGWADYEVVAEQVVYPLPPGVSLEIGAFAEPLSCALHAVEQSGLRIGESVAIVGAGAIGLLTLLVARRGGASELIVSDPDEARRELARRLGATIVVDPTREDLPAIARAATGGRGPDRVFEAVGAAPTIEAALELPRMGGMLVVIGVAPTAAEVRLRPHELFAREATIHFSYIRAFEFGRSVALLASLDLAPLLTHRFPLDQAAEALQAASSRAGVKVQLQPGI